MHKGIPEGWVETTLGAIARPSRNRALPAEMPSMPYVGLEHVEAHSMKLLGRGIASGVRSSSVRFSRGDVLYGKMRPYLNKVWVAQFDGLCSAEFLVFASQDVLNSEFLALRLNAHDFVAFADSQVSGERPRVNFDKLSRFPVLLPPLAEQDRIVTKLLAALARIERAETSSRRAQSRLQRYRGAVLQAAITGEVTGQWRRAHREDAERGAAANEAALRQDGLFGGEPFASEALPDLPQTWQWAAVEQVGDVKPGRKRTPQDHSGKHMRPYLRVANVFENRIDTSDVMRMNFTPDEFKIYRLQDGDILLNEGQSLELVGRPAIYRNEPPECCFRTRCSDSARDRRSTRNMR